MAVATDDISKDEEIVAVFMDDDKTNSSPKQGRYRSGTQNCPKKYWKGEKVIEYGDVIGSATKDISTGEHVHVHNLKSLRWQ